MMVSIGELNEKPLHAALKAACALPGDRFEVPVDGYVVDIVRGELLVEIQTGNFAAIRKKLAKLLKTHRMRLVYPIAMEKWIVKVDPKNGDGPSRRKSPKRGSLMDLFSELIRIPQLMAHPNFSLEVLLTQEEEQRRYVGTGRRHWRKRGWLTEERRLLAVLDRHLFEEPADIGVLLPTSLAETFTTQDIAEAGKIRRPLAQRMAYCLRHLQVIECIGKRHRAYLYTRVRSSTHSCGNRASKGAGSTAG
jgi:hypothetical protein